MFGKPSNRQVKDTVTAFAAEALDDKLSTDLRRLVVDEHKSIEGAWVEVLSEVTPTLFMRIVEYSKMHRLGLWKRAAIPGAFHAYLMKNGCFRNVADSMHELLNNILNDEHR